MITLSFLLFAALCLDAFKVAKEVYYQDEKMSWTEARLYCQKYHIDLVTSKVVEKGKLITFMKNNAVEQVWVGLLRDPEKDSVWKWIDVKRGDGFIVVNPSKNCGDGEQNRHCALVSDDDLKWYSERCSNKHDFYCSVQNNIQHHNTTLTWDDASQYCRNNMSDLATVTSTNTDQLEDAGWIGLHQEADETWKWIGDWPSDYSNWAQGQPLSVDCGYFNSTNKKWSSKVCSEELEFFCYGGGLVVVNENKTWEDARSHCWMMVTPCELNWTCRYHHELLSLEQLSDYDYVRDKIYSATTDEVWTGLRFLGGEWWWMDGKTPQDHGELPDCPSHWRHCGTLSKNDTNNWITRNCSERRNFICSRRKVWYN
ncbi:macrophage mannose receptor 1-like [Sebastes umbrosus]|uniref:macrophage mannose receptor 1-like n=1 Tax=Sebastes umbrosus TaxID=72105 RepID=UPI0018A0EEC8|nr:macrophage mannose receptor 1-like [Sebastes umbrosus]